MTWEEALALHLIPCPGPQRNSELQEQSHLGAARLSLCLPVYTIQQAPNGLCPSLALG